MKDAILLELARRWEIDAAPPEFEEGGSPEAERNSAGRRGMREAKRECADTLRTLISVLGGDDMQQDIAVVRR